MSHSTITFLGGGNMAGAIYGGLVDNGFTETQITVIDPSESAPQQARNMGPSCVLSAAPETINDDLLVLAVKPQIAATVLASLKGKLSASTTVLTLRYGRHSDSPGGATPPARSRRSHTEGVRCWGPGPL